MKFISKMFFRVVSTLLILAMVSGFLPSMDFSGITLFDESAYAEEDTVWEYSVYGDGVELTAYKGSQTDVYIPSSITVDEAELSVIKLADGIFKDIAK